MVPNPATIPVTIPRTLGLPTLVHSLNIHASEPDAAPICVTSIAMPADWSAASAEPALKPNHPTHSIEAPATVILKL